MVICDNKMCVDFRVNKKKLFNKEQLFPFEIYICLFNNSLEFWNVEVANKFTISCGFNFKACVHFNRLH